MSSSWTKFVAVLAVLVVPVLAEDIAVFPAQSVNTDKSFADAFGMVLSYKYGEISGQKVLNPLKAAGAIDSDANLVKAASRLGVPEYLEIEAVGLYPSKREELLETVDSVKGTHVYVNVKSDVNDNGDASDQKLLDNGKTIVTVTRRNQSGAEIYKVEMTLLTYGDIQESCDRIAKALWYKVPVEKTQTLDNITRREGLGKNQLFTQNHKGIKIAAIYPLGYNGEKYSSIVGIGYDMRFDSEKFFLECGAGAHIPTMMSDSSSHSYGGVAFEFGADYFLLPGTIGLYTGGGIAPLLNIGTSGNSPLQFALAPYVQIGVVMPRASRAQFFFDFRISQQIIGINSNSTTNDFSGNGSAQTTTWPFEIGFDLGMQW